MRLLTHSGPRPQRAPNCRRVVAHHLQTNPICSCGTRLSLGLRRQYGKVSCMVSMQGWLGDSWLCMQPTSGGLFSMRITFGDRYPDKAPKVRFTGEMFHPNGKRCIQTCSLTFWLILHVCMSNVPALKVHAALPHHAAVCLLQTHHAAHPLYQ